MAPGESHQLHVAAERIRAPEVLFQTSLVGSHEAGLAETLQFVLKRFSPEDQVDAGHGPDRVKSTYYYNNTAHRGNFLK